jgi:hypothetical protein
MAPRRSQSFSGQYPVWFEGLPNGPFAGEGRAVGVKDFEHATLSRAFGLAESAFWYELPSTCRGVGSSSGATRLRGRIDGFVFMGNRPDPVARIRVMQSGDKLADHDMSRRDLENLNLL